MNPTHVNISDKRETGTTSIWIKFCGTTNLQDALACIEAGANALGFIFTQSARRIDAAHAAEIVAGLPQAIEKIGIVVNETPVRVAELADRVGLTGIQLQGDEDASQMPDFRRALGNRRLIKTLQARELLRQGYGPILIDEFLQHAETLDTILLDSGSPKARGGTGKAFDWNAAVPLVRQIKAELPVTIAGGLNPENVAEAVHLFDPFGVDVVSGVESEVGRKDEAKLKKFVSAARAPNSASR